MPLNRGENLLFADADGATTFPDLIKLEEAMEGLAKNGQVLAKPEKNPLMFLRSFLAMFVLGGRL